jgi:hypothetical protein
VTKSSEGKSVRRFKENLAMNSFWDVSWWDVFKYGVVPPIVLVVAVGLWKLGRASVRLCDAGQLTWPQPGYFVPIGAADDRWSWGDWEWAFSEVGTPEAATYLKNVRPLNAAPGGPPTDGRIPSRIARREQDHES